MTVSPVPQSERAAVESAPLRFVAMEYYWLILNRTFLVAADGEALTGKLVRGLTAVEVKHGGDPITRRVMRAMAVRGDLANPESYVDSKRQARPSRVDFRIPFAAIESVEHDPRRKWGMGPYPHDGRVFLCADGRMREFIVLGAQSGAAITEAIRRSAGLA